MAASPPRTITFAIWGPIARDDLPGLSARVCALISDEDVAVALCDVAGLEVDAVTVDALARLQLAARRQHCRIRLRNASEELRDLIAFVGLDEIFPS